VKGGDFEMKKLTGLMALAVLLLTATSARADLNALSTDLVSNAGSAATIASTVAVAGIAVFVIIWGVRKFKAALRAGS